MNCADFKEQVGALVLGALTEPERAAARAHLDDAIAHDGCREALARAHATRARLDDLPTAPAPAHTWASIERALATTPQEASAATRDDGGELAGVRGGVTLSKVGGLGDGDGGGDGHASDAGGGGGRGDGRGRGPTRRWPWTGWAVAGWGLAAAAVIALWWFHDNDQRRAGRQALQQALEIGRTHQEMTNITAAEHVCAEELLQLRRQNALPAQLVALLAQSDSRVLAMKAQPGKSAEASVVLSAKSARAMVLSTSSAPDGKTLQLWIIRGKAAPIPAGFLQARGPGVAIGAIDPTLLRPNLPDAFAVSLEPAGGSPAPTEILLVAPTRG